MPSQVNFTEKQPIHMQTSAMRMNIPACIIGITVPSDNPINKNTSPKMHVKNAMQPPPTSLRSVPALSSLGPPFGGGGTLGVSISANNSHHLMKCVI